ncbi:hypothetical protein TRIP_C21404 [Candidatus Zixiibacteriota bacterium]|nr:hypothetical protein TRIP_C21404 [candidate division Zixibacteria bacterium]
MDERCIDPKIGILLHAYELGVLNDDDVARFEIHLLKCRHCFEEVISFANESAVLHSDKKVKRVVGREFRENSWRRLWQSLWPDKPVIFRPALQILIVLLLAIPIWYLHYRAVEKQVRPFQTLSLLPMRSGAPHDYRLSSGEDLLLKFVFENAVPGNKYHLLITDKAGKEFYQEDEFDRFDKYGVGQLLISNESLKPGIYHLIIEDPGDTSYLNRQEYYISVLP